MKTMKKMANILAPKAEKTAREVGLNPGCAFILHEPKMPAKLAAQMQKNVVK